MTSYAYTLFDTAIGRCGVVRGSSGICGVQLPEADDGASRGRLLRRFPGAHEAPPPLAVQDAIAGMVALLRGLPIDLTAVALDLSRAQSFERRVYEVTRAIPPGATLTYGEVAARLGEPGSAQAVGRALGRNPVPIIVPCHRVLAAGGRLHGFSAYGGILAKRRILEIEDARTSDAPTLFDFADGRTGGARD